MAGKKFRFSLASVLKLRSYEADRAQDRLAQALRHRNAIADQLGEAEAHLSALMAGERRDGTREIAQLVRADTARKQASIIRDRARSQLEEARVQEEEAREELSICLQKKEALDKLKENELDRYWEAIGLADQKALDEQGFLGFLQRRQKAHI